MLVEGERVVDVGGAEPGLARADGVAVDSEAAVGRLVLGEALEEDDVGRDGDHRIAGHEVPEELGVGARELVGPGHARAPVLAVEAAEVLLQVGRDGLLGDLGDLAQLDLVRQGAAQLGLFLGLRLLPGVVRAPVLLHEAEVADDDVVEGAHRLAEPERLLQLAVEEDLGPRQVGRELQASIRRGWGRSRCGRGS